MQCSLNIYNHIPKRTCQFYMESYMPCHEMRCDSPCTMHPSPHRVPHTTPKPMCDKLSFWMTSNDRFQNNFHSFINQKIFGCYIPMIILLSKSTSLYLGGEFLVSHCGLHKPKHFYDLSPLGTMSNHNLLNFHPREDLSLLLILGTYFLYHFIQS